MKKYIEQKLFKKNKNLEKTNKTDKSAILIGLNYPGSYYSLQGCINDVKNGEEYLKNHGYKTKLLTDNEVSSSFDVLQALNELKKDSSKTVFFHYSGHGTQVTDTNGDEIDGKDETIYSKNGHLITDDEIISLLATFPENKNVVLVFDCCHSGTIADLPYIATLTKLGHREEKVKKPVKANVICISGCRDNQTSADISEGNTAYGALSSSFYDILKKNENKQITWRQLYKELALEMNKKRYEQIPQLSVSDPKLLEQTIML